MAGARLAVLTTAHTAPLSLDHLGFLAGALEQRVDSDGRVVIHLAELALLHIVLKDIRNLWRVFLCGETIGAVI